MSQPAHQGILSTLNLKQSSTIEDTIGAPLEDFVL